MSQITTKSLKIITIAVALLYICVFIFIAASRMGYRFELEYLESGSIMESDRVLSGDELYTAPSVSYVPYIYTPLYFYVASLSTELLGDGYFPLRLVSFISAVLTLLLIFRLVQRDSDSKFAGLLACSLYAATYRLTSSYFDLARVDSLFVLWLIGSLYLLRHHRNVVAYMVAGMFMFLAFMTKQMALAIAVPIAVYCLLSNRPRFFAFAGTFAALIVVSTLWLDSVSSGWYSYYVFKLPSEHQFWIAPIIGYWPLSIFLPMSVAVVVSIAFIHRLLTGPNRDTATFYICMAIGMLGASWMSRSHLGSDANSLMPAYACLSILFGLGVIEISRFAGSVLWNHHKTMQFYIYVICLIQFGSLVYNPSDCIPTENDGVAGERLVEYLSTFPGDVYVPNHPYLAVQAGKRPYAHGMAVRDVLKGEDSPVKQNLVAEIREAFTERRFSAVLLDRARWWLEKDITDNYCRKDTTLFSEYAFWPVSGARTRPERVFLRCSTGTGFDEPDE
jgi:hypothetical protein